MRKTSLLFLILATTWQIGGCDGDQNPVEQPTGVDELKSALPAEQDMTIDLPSSTYLVNEQSRFYEFTRSVTVNVNRFVREITNVIEDVVQHEPTDTDGETYAVWGPYQDALSPAAWRIRVDRLQDGTFDYRVEGWPKDQGPESALLVLEGHHGQETDEAGIFHKDGQWTYHMAAAHQLDPIANPGVGDVAVVYHIAQDRNLEVTLTAVQGPHDPMEIDALYRYTEAQGGAGTFDFISNMDIDEGDPERARRELLQVRSRWLPDGPGRADALASRGDIPSGVEVALVDCWDRAFVTTYESVTYGDLHQENGDATTCAFDERELPRFDGFDPDQFADGDLVEAVPAPDDFEEGPDLVEHPTADPAPYYALTKGFIEGVDRHIRPLLAQIREITLYPPNTCSPDGCTWGPWTDWDQGVSFKLEITRGEGERAYLFTLSSKPFDGAQDAWETLVDGGYTKAQGEAGGSGWYVMDLEAMARAHAMEGTHGSLRCEFSRGEGERTVAVRLDGVQGEDDPAPMSGHYLLTVAQDRSGSLAMAFEADVDADTRPERDAKEYLEAITRWIPGGAGVATARVTGGDVPEGHEFLYVECWDETAAMTYQTLLPRQEGGEDLPEIDARACVYDDWADPYTPRLSDE